MDLYAGYDDGLYNNVTAIKALFPTKTVIAITVKATDNFGDCLDVETGDATPQQAPGWVKARRQAGHGGPLVYCSEALWPTVSQCFSNAGVIAPGYWIAAYPGIGPVLYPGSVGHQFVDHGAWDESVMADYLVGIDPAPIPQPEEEEMPYYVTNSKGTGYAVATDLSHKTGFVSAGDAQNWIKAGNVPSLALTDAQIGNIPGA